MFADGKTKARTKGAKRRAGRKRKTDVKRQPDGSISTKVEIESRGEMVKSETLAHRAFRFGLPLGNEAENAIDALWWREILGDKEYIGEDRKKALHKYRIMMISWKSMVGSGSLGLFRSDHSSSDKELSEADWKICDARKVACEAAIKRLHNPILVFSVLEAVCLDDIAPPVLKNYRHFSDHVADTVYDAVCYGADVVGQALQGMRL